VVDWKKDISFGRKPKPDVELEREAASEPDEVEAEPKRAATPFWKKEVSFGRKPKPEAEPEQEAEAAAEPAAGKTPFWKKEVSLGRKQKPDPDATPELGEPLPLTPVEGSDPAAPERVLRSALEALALQAHATEAPAAAAPAAEPPPVPEPEPELPPAAEAPLEPELPPAPVLPPAAEAPPEPVVVAPEPVLPAAPQASEEPASLAEVPPAAPEEEREQLHPVSWVDAVLHASEAEDAPAAPVAPPAPTPEPILPPAAEAPPLPPTVEPPAALQPVAALPPPLPATPAAFEARAEAPVVHPPVPEAELPRVADEPKVPFWKRELGPSRKPKQPKQAKEPKRAKAEGASAPFWKKELSLGRKPKASTAAVAAAAATAVVKQPSQAEAKKPFWKLELGGSRKRKAAAKAEPAAPGSPAKPLRKKGFSMPRLVLPSTGRRSTARHKELVGLKIGASQIAAALVSNNGVAEVLQVARQEIESGIIVGGELRDPEALADVLKDFFRRNKLPRKSVRLGIANNRIGVRTFEITGIEDAKQLDNAIRFRAQEALPIPIEEAVLDYQVLSETTNEEGESVRKILLVVAYRELVDRYVSACRDAGITLAGIDLEAFALLRSLAAPREDAGPAQAALVAVAVGHDRSTFAVSDGRICEFTRVLDWGGSTLSVAIARALDLTPKEAEPIKRALSLVEGPAPEGISEEVAAAARDAVRRQVNNFARELVSSLQFYQNQPGSLGIGEIMLTGGTAHMPGFAAELQRLIGVRVKLGDPLVRVKVGKRVHDPEQLGSLAIAIGLGIED